MAWNQETFRNLRDRQLRASAVASCLLAACGGEPPNAEREGKRKHVPLLQPLGHNITGAYRTERARERCTNVHLCMPAGMQVCVHACMYVCMCI